MSEETPPQPSKQPELPPDILRMVEMMGGTAVPVDAGTFIGMMGQMTFAKVVEAYIQYVTITHLLLKNKHTPQGEEEQTQQGGLILAAMAMIEATTEHFQQRLSECGFDIESSDTHKAAVVLAMAACVGGALGDLGGTLLRELGSNKEQQLKLKDRVEELRKEISASFKQAVADEDKGPAAPDGKRFVQFDRPKLASLKASYAEAISLDKLCFTFDGAEWDIGYAKYAIEYLETTMAKKGM